MQLPDDAMAELRATFFAECGELMEVALAGLTALEDGLGDRETLNGVFRAIHSIKGGAGAFAMEAVVDFAHELETALDALRSGSEPAATGNTRLLLRACDGLSDLIAEARGGAPPTRAQIDETLAELRAMSGDAQGEEDLSAGFRVTKLAFDLDLNLDSADQSGPASRRWRIDFTPHDALYAHGNEPLFLFRSVAALGALEAVPNIESLPGIDQFVPGSTYVGWTLHLTTDASEEDVAGCFEFVEGLCDLQIALVDVPATLPPAPERSVAKAPDAFDVTDSRVVDPPPPARPTLRVDLNRADQLANLVGELAIHQSMLAQNIADAGFTPGSTLCQSLDRLSGLTRDIQTRMMTIRAQPMTSLFQRMSRIIREASASAGKPVRFTTDGASTETDRAVIEGLVEPLTHVLRNAVDHGLETPEARRKAGKPAEGSVRMTATHRSGRVVLDIADDGSGIDRGRVLETAIERGLVAAGAALSDAEIDELIFVPGFSTASAVSNLSGRGVGMDVVRNAIRSLGGRIAIRSASGRGTVVSISLPVALGLLDGMIVDVAGERLVVPVHSIVETLSLTGSEIRQIAPGKPAAVFRDQLLAVLDLGAELGFRAPRTMFEEIPALVVAPEGDTPTMLLVDAIHDQRQVTLKRLQDGFSRTAGVAAATVLGDGQVALILDLAEIVQRDTVQSASPRSVAR